jgi:ribosomal protein S18 acetylase RimI-like enzyme
VTGRDDTFTIRLATLDDVPAIEEVVQSAYRGETSREGWTTEADLLDGVRTDRAAVAAAISGPGGLMLVAVDAAVDPAAPVAPDEAPPAEVLACCQLERRDGDVAYFGMFAVRPGRQGGGVGRRLLAAAEDYASSQWSAGTMEMTVIMQRDELIDWYVRRGYVRTRETRPFPYGDVRFGRPRRDDLEFVVLRKRLGPASG